MKLALLGLDPTTLALAQAAVDSGQHTIAYLSDFDADQTDNDHYVEGELSDAALSGRLAVIAAGAELLSWELLLDGDVHSRKFDALIVARGSDPNLRMDQLRKLVQAGVPMLVVHPVLDSMLLYYELEMIRAESGCPMVPFIPMRWHPAAKRLQAILLQSSGNLLGTSASLDEGAASPGLTGLGRVDQVVVERAMHNRSRDAIAAQFARDVDLIRYICGDVTRLGAMGSPGKNDAGEHLAYNNLGIQLTGAGPLLTRWSVGPVERIEGGRLIATGTHGKAIWHFPADSFEWPLEIRRGDTTTTEQFENWDPYVEGIQRLEQAICNSGSSSPTASAPTREMIEPSWNDAARSIELAETVDRSLTKNRSIELHQEEFSDIGTFKGFMTSVGCALLMIGLMLMISGALAAKLLKAAGWPAAAQIVGWIPYLMLAVFGIFLMLQLVLKLATSGKTDKTS